MLSTTQKLILLIALLTGISLTAYHTSRAEEPKPNDLSPRLWLLKQYMTSGFGIYVNDTIYDIGDYNTTGVLLDNAYNNCATTLYYQIFQKIKYVRPAIEPTAYLTKTNATSPVYLINPTLNNKWVMPNTSNIYHYGFDYSKALLVTQDFLDRFPTAYYF